MRLGLGNNLVKTAFPIGTSPSLDLAFALDRSFTTDPAAAGNALITSRRGPAAKFSRGSGATQVNAAGLIEYAPENLLVRSNEFSSATWGRTTLGLPAEVVEAGPNGELAWQLQPSGSNSDIGQNITIPSGGSAYTFSVWLKSDTGNNVSLRLNIYDNTATTLRGFKIITVTPEWQRFEVSSSTVVSGNSTRFIIGAFSSWSAGENLLTYGAQVERASTARTYYPTTTAAFYGPRFDHDPATGDCKGLLIEETRTNLLLRSEAFETISWLKGGPQPAVITADNVTSPSGALTADTLAMPAITSGQYSLAAQQISGTAVPYTLTFYVKSAAGGQTIWASFTPDGVNYFRQPIVLTTEWQRVSLTATLTATQWFAQIGIDRRDSSQTGTANFEFHVWGAQLEAGAFPTSYIPTTSGTATRSADVCSITGADFSSFYNQSEGSFAASVFFNAPVTYTVGQIVFDVNDTTSLNRLRIVRGAPSGVLYYSNTVSAVQDVSIVGPTSISASNITKIAGCMKTNDFAVYLDSTLQGTDTSAIMQASPTTFTIGEVSVGTATKAPLNGHISRIQYFRKRLSNAKLQTLTAP